MEILGGDFTENITVYSLNSVPLSIRTEPYEKFKDGGYNKILSMLPGVILEENFYGVNLTQRQQAIKLKRKRINLYDLIPKREFGYLDTISLLTQ